jgi:hypothetical protein
MKPLLLLALALASTLGLGCQRISAREVLPEYVKKKEEAAAKQAQPEPAQANPPTFFPGQKID